MQKQFFCRAEGEKALLACFFALLVCAFSAPFNRAHAQVVIRERLELTPPTSRMTLVEPASQTLPEECKQRGAEYADYVSGGETSQTAKFKGTFVFIPRTAHFMGGELGGTFEVVNETQQTTTRFTPSLSLSDVFENSACHRSGEAARFYIYSGSSQKVRIPVNAGDRIRVYYHFNGRTQYALFTGYHAEAGLSYRTLSVNNGCNCCYLCTCFKDPEYVWARLSMEVYFEPELPDRFALSFGRDTLALGESTWLQVQARDAEGNAVLIDDDAPVYLSLNTTRYGSFHDTVSGTRASRLDNYRYGDAKRKRVYYIADGDPGEAAPTSGMASLTSGSGTVLASAVPVRVTALGCELAGSKAVMVTPALDHFEVQFGNDPLRHLKLTSVYVQAKDTYGNAIDIADDTRLTLRLLQGADLGSMKRSLAQASDAVITVTYGDVKPGPSAASGVVFWADGINPVGWEQHDRTVRIAASLSEDPTRQGWGTLEVLGDYRIRLSVDPDTVLHRETAILQVQAIDLEGLPVTIPDHLPVDFELASASAAYGVLRWKDQEGTRLTGVPYAAARAWQVQFLANGILPEETIQVKIRASLTDDSWIEDDDVVAVKKPRWKIKQYFQGGDESWADDQYDHAIGTYDKMRHKGCALTALTMAMTGFGIDVDPGQLNEWKKNHSTDEGGYSGTSVNWSAAFYYSNQRITADRKGKRMYSTTHKKHLWENISVTAELGKILEDNNLVLVQVYNPDSPTKSKEHWVLVTSKNGAGGYDIYDPGYSSKKLLGAYENRFWGYVIVSSDQR